LVVGKEGSNIKTLTNALKREFNLENPQIEINEISDPNTNAQIVAERIASALERYGTTNFKGIMHKAITDVMHAGVKGVEIVVSGKIPGSRAKSWRVLSGYMKKCGDIAVMSVQFAKAIAKLKSGIVGVKVRIMPSGLTLPDSVKITEEDANQIIQEEVKEVEEEPKKEEKEATKEEPKKHRKTKQKKEKKSKPESKEENDKESKTAQRAEQSGTEKQAERT